MKPTNYFTVQRPFPPPQPADITVARGRSSHATDSPAAVKMPSRWTMKRSISSVSAFGTFLTLDCLRSFFNIVLLRTRRLTVSSTARPHRPLASSAAVLPMAPQRRHTRSVRFGLDASCGRTSATKRRCGPPERFAAFCKRATRLRRVVASAAYMRNDPGLFVGGCLEQRPPPRTGYRSHRFLHGDTGH